MKELQNIISEVALESFAVNDADIEITIPDAKFGDFATNIAMKLAKTLGKNPREIAEQIVAKLNTQGGIVSGASVAGPGFINIKITNSYYQNILQQVIEQKEDYGKNDINKDLVIVSEYSDPNPFKPLHAGHLYTTLVGDAISRLLEVSGAKLTRISYGGDVGLHVGRAMWAIIDEIGEDAGKLNDIPEAERSKWLGKMYVKGTSAYGESDELKEQVIATNKRVYEIYKTNDHDSEFAKIYWACRGWSYEYFVELYDALQVVQFDRTIPESEIVPLAEKIVKEQLENGVYEKSDGAVIFDGDKHGLHTRVFINSEGLPTYEAKDIGLIFTKWNDYNFDQSIIITADEQLQYMQVVLKSIEQFAPELAKRTNHITHGVVKLTGGKKMSSRKGGNPGAIDIIDAAEKANKEITSKDNHDAVLAAVKYSFLKSRIGGDIIYNPAESVSVLGNSGPYLQYAYARAKSILAKADAANTNNYSIDFTDDEKALVRKISEYSGAVEQAVADLMPHHVCTYLYELAQEFNRFYERNKVIGDAREAQRLVIINAYTQVLQNGLNLLGIKAPERM